MQMAAGGLWRSARSAVLARSPTAGFWPSGGLHPAPVQSQQVQQQVKQQMEGLMQQARPMPDDSK